MSTQDSYFTPAWFKRVMGEVRQVGSEIRDLAAGVKHLGETEVELGKTEMRENIQAGTRAAAFAAFAALLAVLALVFVFLTIMFALATALEIWLAALLTSLIALLLAAGVGMLAMRYAKRLSFYPNSKPAPKAAERPPRSSQDIERELDLERQEIKTRVGNLRGRLSRHKET